MSAALFLVFMACSASSCRTVELPWQGSLFECLLFGQQSAAAYATERGLTVRQGWRCEQGKPT